MIILKAAFNGVTPAELGRFARRAQKLAGAPGEIAVLITRNQHIRRLNRQFRSQDKPTDVLSFAHDQGGDIAISIDIARDSATRYGHPLADELKVLILHGMLHLAGFDHESDSGQMGLQESALRKKLKLPDSLIARAGSTDSARRRR